MFPLQEGRDIAKYPSVCLQDSRAKPIAIENGAGAFSGGPIHIGREILKSVPLLPGRTLLRILMVPRWRSTIFLEIANPRPVPRSSFVVKNGWKILLACSAGIP